MKIFFTTIIGFVAAIIGILTAAVILVLVAAAIPTTVLAVIGIAARVWG